MRTRVDARFLEELERFSLRFSCDDCAHFDGRACTHGYPGGERRRPLSVDETIVFCKEFEVA